MITHERKEKLLRNLRKLQAYRDIQNIMGRAAAALNFHEREKLAGFFALSQPDVSLEYADEGLFVGREAVEAALGLILGGEPRPGEMLDMQLTTPVIEVAEDARTAKALWWCPGAGAIRQDSEAGNAGERRQSGASLDGGEAAGGASLDGGEVAGGASLDGGEAPGGASLHGRDAGGCAAEPEAVWYFGMVAADFIRTEDSWQIWHLHYFRLIKCDYTKGWVEDTSMVNRLNTPMHPLSRPATWHNPYTPLSVRDGIPAAPRPYETWTEEEAGWMLRKNADETGMGEVPHG